MNGKKYIAITIPMAVILLIMVIHGKPSPAQTAGEKFEGAMLQGRVVSPYGPVENARVRVAIRVDRQARIV